MGKLLDLMQKRNVALGGGMQQDQVLADNPQQKQAKDLFVQSFCSLPEETRVNLLNEYFSDQWKDFIGTQSGFSSKIREAKRQGDDAVRNFVTNDDSFGRPWQDMIPVMEDILTPEWVENDAYKGMDPNAGPEEKAFRLLTSKTLNNRMPRLWQHLGEERREQYRQEGMAQLNAPATFSRVLDEPTLFAPGKNWQQFVNAVETAMGEKAVEDAVNEIDGPAEGMRPLNVPEDYEERTMQPADLPNRRQRRALVEQLRKLEEEGRNVPGYAEYLEKMVALDQQMEDLSRRDSRGMAKPLSLDAQTRLRNSIRETALAGENYIKNVREAINGGKKYSLKKGAPGIVGQLQGMLAADEQVLSRCDPSMGLSLPEVLEGARTKTLILDSAQMNTMGGNQNSRIPLSIQNADGKEYRGVFTKATYSHTQERIRKAIEAGEELIETEEGKAEFAKLMPKMREHFYKKYPKDKYPQLANVSDTRLFLWTIEEFTAQGSPGRNGAVGRVMFKSGEFCEKLGLDMDKIGEDAMRAFGSASVRLRFRSTNEMINTLDLGVPEGARIDSRNSAMSAVADLLGVPGLLARSTNMRFTDGQGKTQEGTIMDFGKGLDLNDDLDLFKHVNDDPFSGEESYKAFKQIADLQVLDYICGNIDRHAGNLMYKTNAAGDIIGVQGIDNDSSFGSFGRIKNNYNRLPGTDNMKCISKSMSDTVMKMDPAMLKFMLRGRGLTEREMDFAVRRMTDLQDAIKKGKEHYKNRPSVAADPDNAFDKGFLRVVSDEDFKKLSLEDLVPENEEVLDPRKIQSNLFNEVKQFTDDRLYHARSEGIQFDEKATTEERKLAEFKTEGQTYSGQALLRSIEGAGKLVRDGEFKIDDLTKSSHGSSPEFDKMAAAAKKLAALEQKLADEVKGRQEKGHLHYSAVEYERLRRPIAEAKKELNETTDTYLNKKMRERHAADLEHLRGKNTYERNRIAHAMKLRSYAQGHEVPPAIPDEVLKSAEGEGLEIKVANELSAEEEARAAVRMLREIHEKLGLEDPDKYKGMDGETFNETLKEAADLKKAAEGQPPQYHG